MDCSNMFIDSGCEAVKAVLPLNVIHITCTLACIHTYIHTHIHTHTHTHSYIRTYIHAYIHKTAEYETCHEYQITNSTNTKFLGSAIKETLSWKCHTSQILSRLSSACYVMKVIMPLMSEDILKIIYYSYVHLIVTYDIIFWGNWPHSTNIFKIQKRIIRIMTKSRSRDSCRQLFKRLEILPLQSQYTFSVLLFVVKNKDLCTTNQEIHNITTRLNTNLHPPVWHLTVFQKGAYYSVIKLFNHLPLKVKSLSNEIKLFKPALKRFLNLHSFYSVDEYLEYSFN